MILTFILGLSYGVLLFLISAGLTLIFGMLGIINFTHGALYMLGAYVTFSVVSYTGNFWLAFLVAPFVVGVLGLFIEIITLRPLYKRSLLYQVILTFGLVLILEEVVKAIWGPTFQQVVTPPSLAGPVSLFGVIVPKYRIFIIVFGAVIGLALLWLIEKTKIGMVIRASASNSMMVRCLGLDVNKVFTGVFAGGSALAAIGGVVAAP
ncbi:branched-chain amino acid ABC transporter permease, partial [bacterium]|nr:branched-chain amino acid ABC transporter permease [bacterium]